MDSKIAVTEYVDNSGFITTKKVTKLKVKEPNGKYVDAMRTERTVETYQVSTSDGLHQIKYNEKNVYKLNDGKSMTEYVGHHGEKIQILRDKKGKILEEKYIKSGKGSGPDNASGLDELDEVKTKLLAQWYRDYLKLCKKYNVLPLNIEAGDAALCHYRDLLLRDTDYIEFLSHLKILEYRASYDPDAAARLMRLNGLGFDIEEIAGIFRNVREEEGIESLKEYVENLCFRLPEYEKTIMDIYQYVQPKNANAYNRACNQFYEIA